MSTDALFCSLTPSRLADLVRSAQQAVCYAGPGIQLDLAQSQTFAGSPIEIQERLRDEWR